MIEGAERVREMNVIGARVEPRQEAREAARRREPVNQRDTDEHDADDAQNPWHWLGHEAGLTDARASGKRPSISLAFFCGARVESVPARFQRATVSRELATRASEVDEASALTPS